MMKSRFFATTVLAALICASAGPALAADPAPPANAGEIAARFKAADKNGDGKLTLEEAKAGMPRIAAAFDKIDTDKKGYVTLAEIMKVVENQ